MAGVGEESVSGVGGLLDNRVRGMSSSSVPISSARSMTDLFELPDSICSPRVKYAVVASITTKPNTDRMVNNLKLLEGRGNYERLQ